MTCPLPIFRRDEAAEAKATILDTEMVARMHQAVREQVIRAAFATLHADRKARLRRAALVLAPHDPTQPEDAA